MNRQERRAAEAKSKSKISSQVAFAVPPNADTVAKLQTAKVVNLMANFPGQAAQTAESKASVLAIAVAHFVSRMADASARARFAAGVGAFIGNLAEEGVRLSGTQVQETLVESDGPLTEREKAIVKEAVKPVTPPEKPS